MVRRFEQKIYLEDAPLQTRRARDRRRLSHFSGARCIERGILAISGQMAYGFLHPGPIRRKLRASLALLALVFAGCAGVDSSRIREGIRTGSASGHYVEGVPFVRQDRFYCGPAAISTVEKFFGEDVEQSGIAEEVFSKSVKGTLTLDIELYARRQGYWSRRTGRDIADLKQWLNRDVPVAVLLQVGPRYLRKYHFIVLVGYSDHDRVFLAHDGARPNALTPFHLFERRWRRAGRWGLVMAPPDKVTWQLDAAGHNDLGVRYEKLGRPQKSLHSYENAIAADASNPLYHFNRANVLFKLHKGKPTALVIAGFQKALDLDPDFADARNNLAYLLMLQGKLDEALSHARRAVGHDGPTKFEHWETLAEVYEARGDPKKAAASYLEAEKKARLTSKQRAKLDLSLAGLELRLGRKETAAGRLRALLDRHPSERVVARARELLRQANGDRD